MPAMVYINKQKSTRNAVRRPMHSHDSICELLLIYEGEGTYHVQDQVYPLKPGCLIFYNQGELHEVCSANDYEIGSYCIGITNLRRKGLKRNHLVSAGEAYVKQSADRYPMLKTMCEQMFELEEAGEDGRLAAQFMFNSFLTIAMQIEKFQEIEPLTKKEQKGLHIQTYLDQHFTEDITLEQIGKSLGCSETYISHTFREAMGITPIRYVIQRRMGYAQTLLISTELSVSQIATMSGYDDANYFSTQFTRVVGMNPTKYRDLYKEELRGRKNQS
ncbi:MAG: AraC family transcriptional regulator [Clostridia bacterium]|nr:AraC family transcriptional regulator [Clostridia bacterium]NCC42604.1 AraC family transcriptional regulator [Clostridia bacterium]